MPATQVWEADINALWLPTDTPPAVPCQYQCPYQAPEEGAEPCQYQCPYEYGKKQDIFSLPPAQEKIAALLSEDTSMDTLLRDLAGEAVSTGSVEAGGAPVQVPVENDPAFVELQAVLDMDIPKSLEVARLVEPQVSKAVKTKAGTPVDDEACEICYDGEKMDVTESRFAVCGHGSLICDGCNGQLELCPFCRIPALDFQSFGSLGFPGSDGKQSSSSSSSSGALLLKTGAVETSSLLTPSTPAPSLPPCDISGGNQGSGNIIGVCLPPPPALPPLSLDGSIIVATTAQTSKAPRAPAVRRGSSSSSSGNGVSSGAPACKAKSGGEKKRRIRNTKGPHKSAMDAKLFAIFTSNDLLLGKWEWHTRLRAVSYTMTAEEIVRVKQLRRREKSKSYSQKYRDVNAKGTLVWPAYAAEQGAEQGQCQALPVAGLG